MEKKKGRKAFVKIMLKDEVLDPQGKAVLSVLKSSGYTNVGDVRVGKYVELKLNIDSVGLKSESGEKNNGEKNNGGSDDKVGSGGDALLEEIEEISHKVLSNPLIEDFSIEIV